MAAGSGQRFGSDKRLALLPDGRHVLCAALAVIAEAFDDWRVVLRAIRDAHLPAELALDPARVTFSERAAGGMGMALADAVGQAPPEWDVVWVALGDMPWLATTTLLALQDAAAASAAQSIVRPVHRGRPGHPVGFPRCLRHRLVALDGDAGARELLRRPAANVVEVEVDDAGIHRDVDRPDDLAGHDVTNSNET